MVDWRVGHFEVGEVRSLKDLLLISMCLFFDWVLEPTRVVWSMGGCYLCVSGVGFEDVLYLWKALLPLIHDDDGCLVCG